MVATENAFTTVTPIKAVATETVPVKAVAPTEPPPPTAQVAPKVVARKVAKKSTPVKTPAARKTAKTTVKNPDRPVVKTGAKPAGKASAKPKLAKPAKAKKPKLVHEGFTIPKTEYGVLAELKQRASKLAAPVKKNQLLRAGIKALVAMSDSVFLAVLGTATKIKTGRRAKG